MIAYKDLWFRDTAGIVLYADPFTLTEGFDDVSALTGKGWVLINRSTPGGESAGFVQGQPGVLTSFSGAPDSFLFANFANAPAGGTISTWALTPVIDFSSGGTLTFYTISENVAEFPDSLQVRFSIAGASSNVGSSTTSTGDFGNVLLSVNPTLQPGGYPGAWTQYTAVIAAQPGVSGRLAFRYAVNNTNSQGASIGIDDFLFTNEVSTGVPEPASLVLTAVGLGLFIGYRRRRLA